MRKVVGILLMIIFLAGAVTGCNTMRGVGEDVEQGGEEIQDVAE